MQKININRMAKNIGMVLSIFIGVLFLLFLLFFSDFKKTAFNNAKNNYELNIEKYSTKFEEKAILFDKSTINQYIKEIKNTDFIVDVKINYKKFLISKENLIFQTSTFDDNSWNLADIIVDTKFGEIKSIGGSSFFEFIPSENFNINESLIVKYQLFKNNEIKNFVVPIDLNFINNEELKIKKDEYSSFFEYFYDFKMDNKVTKILKKENIEYATVDYYLDDSKLKKFVSDFFNKLWISAFISFLPIVFFVFYYYRYVENKYIIKPIRYLDKVISNISEHKFSNIENSTFHDNVEYKNLLTNVSKLSNKVASLVNELNINKETLERNLLTDSSTGLYDKKMFDIDMKSMFVSSTEGYIFLIKIGKLNQIETLNGRLRTDDFILSFVNIVNNVIHTYKDKELTFYRLQGAEFLVLARNLNYLDAVDFADRVINNLLVETNKNYKLPNNIFHIGGTPIDKYGTIDSIMNQVLDAYTEAVTKGGNSYEILEESKIKEETDKTEATIKHIIDNSDFGLSFAYDSYSFDEELLMREFKAILKDSVGNVIPIGSFVAISEKLNLNRRFDEDVILKVLEYAKLNAIKYKIAINLSMKTIADEDFIKFLKQLVSKDEDIRKYIVFSITSYSASAYKDDFINFVEESSILKMPILLKRYKTKEYPLEELAQLDISYIKIDKTLTQNIYNDLIKKHVLKNIIIFADLHEVKLIVENVESDKDFAFLSRQDLYAVNR